MQFLDLTTLITIAIAVFILLYLRSILGQRTGHEKPDEFFENVAKRSKEKQQDGPAADNVVKLPSRNEDGDVEAKDPRLEEVDALAKPKSKLNRGLKEVCSADRSFLPSEFLSGSEMAYEMIVTAFADGDKRTLKNLLSSDVFKNFSGVIDDRANRSETVISSFVGIDESQIKSADMDGSVANLTVRFVSQIVSATFDKDNKLIEGDKQEVVRVKDIWTFSRDTRSSDPNWKLVATESEA